MTKILIKYDYTGEEINVNDITLVDFKYNKCVNISFMDNDPDSDKLLRLFDGHVIAMKFCGESKYDKLSLFSIDGKKVMRSQKLKDILED